MPGAVSSTRVRRAVRENRLAADAWMPGAITPPMNSPLSETTSKFVAGAEVHDDRRPAVPRERRERVHDAVGADLARVVGEDRARRSWFPGPTITGGDGK